MYEFFLQFPGILCEFSLLTDCCKIHAHKQR